MNRIKTFAAAPAMLAALSLSATPSVAAEIPVQPAPASAVPDLSWDAGESSDYHRRYRYRRHRGVSAGDVLTGVLIIGGIAAIANSAKQREERRRDYRDVDYRDDRYRDRDSRYRTDDVRGIDRAVSQCVREIERDVRVESVDSVDRSADGWQVGGTLYNGDAFTCRIGPDGRIEDVDYSDRQARYDGDAEAGRTVLRGEDRQLSDERYRTAWADVETGPDAPSQSADQGNEAGAMPAMAEVDQGKLPAYPGGPIDGDLDE